MFAAVTNAAAALLLWCGCRLQRVDGPPPTRVLWHWRQPRSRPRAPSRSEGGGGWLVRCSRDGTHERRPVLRMLAWCCDIPLAYDRPLWERPRAQRTVLLESWPVVTVLLLALMARQAGMGVTGPGRLSAVWAVARVVLSLS